MLLILGAIPAEFRGGSSTTVGKSGRISWAYQRILESVLETMCIFFVYIFYSEQRQTMIYVHETDCSVRHAVHRVERFTFKGLCLSHVVLGRVLVYDHVSSNHMYGNIVSSIHIFMIAILMIFYKGFLPEVSLPPA